MVIVVPTFTERDQRQPKVVAAFVRSIEAARAPQVGQRIDGEGAVVENDGRNHVAPQKGRPSADQGHDCAKRHRRNPVVPIQPADFRETGETQPPTADRIRRNRWRSPSPHAPTRNREVWASGHPAPDPTPDDADDDAPPTTRLPFALNSAPGRPSRTAQAWPSL